MVKMVNLGCGPRHIDKEHWVNIDFEVTGPGVIPFNLIGGIPLDDASVDFVYSSHFLEHLHYPDAVHVIEETNRILRPHGVIRIAVPDLERLVREYIFSIELLKNPSKRNESTDSRHDYMVVELLDQLTRNEPGGRKRQFLRNLDIEDDGPLMDFISVFTGRQLEDFPKELTRKPRPRYRGLTLPKIIRKARSLYFQMIVLLLPSTVKQRLEFSNLGEKHRWVYDYFQLQKILVAAGFADVNTVDFDKSSNSVFAKENLDVGGWGGPYKGSHTLIIEAVKQ